MLGHVLTGPAGFRTIRRSVPYTPQRGTLLGAILLPVGGCNPPRKYGLLEVDGLLDCCDLFAAHQHSVKQLLLKESTTGQPCPVTN